MPTTLYSCSLNGLNCEVIEVEVHLTQGLPAFNIVGLGDTAIHESRERTRSAIINSGFNFSMQRKTVNLAPAYIKKQGPLFDLPIALGLLIESKQLHLKDINKSLIVGELALDGRIKSARGILVITDFAKKKGFKKIYLPKNNEAEAMIINGITVIGVENLNNFHAPDLYLKPSAIKQTVKQKKHTVSEYDFSLITGQKHAKRSMEIAAAGQHHLLMSGPPGCGKTLLARSFPCILPAPTFQEQLEISRVYSIAGLLEDKNPIITGRPFREVHPTASAVAIIGGGSNPRPGEISLAHRGVLFMDEIAEFPRSVLDSLRQPLESKSITVNRARHASKFPAAFQLIAAMNPCPCGFYNQPQKDCKCGAAEILNYQAKISGPLQDRIDMFIQMHPVKLNEDQNEHYATYTETETSKSIADRVEKAFKLQQERYKIEPYKSNAALSLKGIKKYVPLSPNAKHTLNLALQKLDISMRAYHRILKLALTIADLKGSTQIKEAHVSEAISYRT